MLLLFTESKNPFRYFPTFNIQIDLVIFIRS